MFALWTVYILVLFLILILYSWQITSVKIFTTFSWHPVIPMFLVPTIATVLMSVSARRNLFTVKSTRIVHLLVPNAGVPELFGRTNLLSLLERSVWYYHLSWTVVATLLFLVLVFPVCQFLSWLAWLGSVLRALPKPWGLCSENVFKC